MCLCLFTGSEAEPGGADRLVRSGDGEGAGRTDGRRHPHLPEGRPRHRHVPAAHRQGLLQVCPASSD